MSIYKIANISASKTSTKKQLLGNIQQQTSSLKDAPYYLPVPSKHCNHIINKYYYKLNTQRTKLHHKQTYVPTTNPLACNYHCKHQNKRSPEAFMPTNLINITPPKSTKHIQSINHTPQSQTHKHTHTTITARQTPNHTTHKIQLTSIGI
eukprot:gene3110-2092_t